MYPVCIVGGCHNCQFNVSVFNILRIWEGARWYQYIYRGETSPESWGWWLVRLEKGGSIATLGYTGLDYFAIGDYDNDSIPDCVQHYSGFMNVNFFKNYANGTDILGQIHAQTINDLSENMYILKKAGGNTIFTPHPGEMSGLLGKSIESIQNNRLSSAVEFAREHDVIVLLKGHRTVVTDGNHVYINTTGNPGMATAGSGDVLCGVIASCTAIVDDKAKAAAVAAYIHGAAGDRAAVRFGEYSMKSGDIITEIPWIMKNITGV